MSTRVDNPSSEPPGQVTVTCGSCHRTVTQWTTVLLQPEQAHSDEIEITNAHVITRLCGYCIEHLDTEIRAAITAIVTSVKAA